MSAVLIAGLSTRAAAASAARAGFVVTSIDAFGDLDSHPDVRSVSLPRDFGVPFTASAAARAAAGFRADAVVYLANFENDPDAVEALASGRTLWGNAPHVLRRVRNPQQVASAFRDHGIAAPSVRLSGDEPPGANEFERNDWLLKPVASGGGRGVKPWHGDGVAPGYYLQQRIDGIPASVVFVSAGGVAVPLGVSLQLVGDAAFGADGYRYCGNILAPPSDPSLKHDQTIVDGARTIASVAAAAFGLVGVNGVDFIAANGMVHPIEVNPRWSSAMELVERAYHVSVFDAHAAACARSMLPVFDLHGARERAPAVGKAIVFARTHVAAGDTTAWLSDATVSDVPQPGERIARGRPVCTVVAEASDAASCYAALVGRAERIYASLETVATLD